MADAEHVELLTQGREAWNNWRQSNPDLEPDLSTEILFGADLSGFNLARCNLVASVLAGADLRTADLSKADLSHATLLQAKMDGAKLTNATLFGANLSSTSLTGVDAREANLMCCVLVDADLRGANISGARVYGVAAWDTNLSGVIQRDLIITRPEERNITLDQIEMAQFINLVVRNSRMHDALDTLSSKLVLLLGRFSDGRKAVLETLRSELRGSGLVPVVFDFEKTARRSMTETVVAIASLACFMVADITDGHSVQHELQAIVPQFDSLSVVLVEHVSNKSYAMVEDILKKDNVKGLFQYDDSEDLRELVRDQLKSWSANNSSDAAQSKRFRLSR